MAKAVQTMVAKEVRTVEMVPSGVTLMLSDDEAQLLYDIAGMIGGNPKTTRRGLMDGIYAALHAAGVKSKGLTEDVDDHECRIYFK